MGQPEEDLRGVEARMLLGVPTRVTAHLVLQRAAERQVHHKVGEVRVCKAEVEVGNEGAREPAGIGRAQVDENGALE